LEGFGAAGRAGGCPDAFVPACFVSGVARGFAAGRLAGCFAGAVVAFVDFLLFVAAGRADGALRAVGRFLAGMVTVAWLAVAAR
jgi:hypothetical protein